MIQDSLDRSRRHFLARSCSGLGALAASALLSREATASAFKPLAIDAIAPLSPRPPHFAPTAKRVIFLFQYGGPPQMDTWDYKPELAGLHGKPVPDSIKKQADKVGGVFNHCHDRVLAGPWKFARRGESGLWVSEAFPRLGSHADDLCVIKSMHCESSNHAPATYQMNTGVIIGGKPSLGSWLTYGLGSENQNLPGYVLLFDVGGLGGSANWSNGFLPAAFQGTKFRHTGEPVLNLRPPAELAGTQRSTIDMIQAFNTEHREKRPGLLDLDGRIASYELAFRMQAAAMDVGDLSREDPATLEMYGIDHKNKNIAKYARMCLLSRRLIEKGVRIVQTYQTPDKLGWDSHENNTDYVNRNAQINDQPVAALLTDLKQRGLLEETLVIWAGEFGRTSMEQGNGGRNHNPYGFSIWLAGGGVRGGQSIGETDEIGLRAVKDPVAVKDLHATILHAMGIRCDDLFFEASGRPERLTGVAGTAKVVDRVFA
jgi:hypothetical protein